MQDSQEERVVPPAVLPPPLQVGLAQGLPVDGQARVRHPAGRHLHDPPPLPRRSRGGGAPRARRVRRAVVGRRGEAAAVLRRAEGTVTAAPFPLPVRVAARGIRSGAAATTAAAALGKRAAAPAAALGPDRRVTGRHGGASAGVSPSSCVVDRSVDRASAGRTTGNSREFSRVGYLL